MLVCLGARRCGLERGGVTCCAAVRHATWRGVLRFAAVRCGMVWPERGETPAAKKEKEAEREEKADEYAKRIGHMSLRLHIATTPGEEEEEEEEEKEERAPPRAPPHAPPRYEF